MTKNTPGSENVRYEVITQEDPETGDIIIPLPPAILTELGWGEGTVVDFGVDDKGHMYLKRANT